MGRFREVTDVRTAAAPADANPLKHRGDALSDAAYITKRSADTLIEVEEARAHAIAGFAGAGGVLALLLGVASVAHLAPPQLLLGLAAIALLAPTALAFSQSVARASRIADASFERGLCQGMAAQAKRLGDVVGATDRDGIPLTPEAVISGQLDALYRDLDRSNKRLKAAGADPGQKTAANRLHERIVPNNIDTILIGYDGRRYPVRIVDVSQSGIAVKGALPPFYQGEQVQVGSRRGKVVKIGAGEAALQFLVPILPSEFNKKIIV